MESTIQKIEDVHEQRESYEESVQTEEKALGREVLPIVYQNIYSCYPDISGVDSDSCIASVTPCDITYMDLYLEDQKCIKFIKKRPLLSCVIIDEFRWDYFKTARKNEALKLLLSFPERVISFNFNNSLRDPINLPTLYLDSIIRLNFRVLNKMRLECFCINFCNLKKFITSFRHVETLCIFLCKLSIPEIPDFTKALSYTNIQKFKLCWSGLPNANNWEENPEELTNLIKGLATSPDLKLSLQEVDLRRCGVDIAMATSLLEGNGFGSVKITI
ncbi:unnamed protein product [Moneuplotes crassus]|uniref:Uncharacterized protein n=1 Tax=Euplotes crassus TaxID=5936 RepID=A0AAD1XL12_EUPCR|nr:unnamed protein product [Moneuplotes crassus]